MALVNRQSIVSFVELSNKAFLPIMTSSCMLEQEIVYLKARLDEYAAQMYDLLVRWFDAYRILLHALWSVSTAVVHYGAVTRLCLATQKENQQYGVVFKVLESKVQEAEAVQDCDEPAVRATKHAQVTREMRRLMNEHAPTSSFAGIEETTKLRSDSMANLLKKNLGIVRETTLEVENLRNTTSSRRWKGLESRPLKQIGDKPRVLVTRGMPSFYRKLPLCLQSMVHTSARNFLSDESVAAEVQ
eukprot:2234892-Pyramimonas_sp.AAC.1